MQPEVLLFTERCLACGSCMDVCPSRAISRADGWGYTLDRARCTVCGTCTDACPMCVRQIAGESVEADALMQEIVRDRPFFDMSGGGVTISGGEPLLQPAFVVDILERCRREHIHTAVETCGLGNHSAALRIAELADVILFDLKLADSGRHQRATGVANHRIIANLQDIAQTRASLIVRFALIPGMTDDRANVEGIAALMHQAGASVIHVLPYHRAGMAKYERLGRRYWLGEVPPPSSEDIAAAVNRFKECGLQAFAGGLA